MKVLNTRSLKEKLDKVLDLAEIYEAHEEESYSPCWQIQVDRESDQLVFLIDAQTVMKHPLKDVKSSLLTVASLGNLIKILREGKLEQLKQALNVS